MKKILVAIAIGMMVLPPVSGQTPESTAVCAEDPLGCLRVAYAYVENNEKGTENLAGLRVAYAGALSRNGAFSEAMEVAAVLERPRDSALAYSVLAQELAKAGLAPQAGDAIARATEEMGRVQYESLRMELLTAVIKAQVLAGDFDSANMNAETVVDFINTQEAGWRRSDPIERLVKTGVLFDDLVFTKGLIASIERAEDRAAPMTEVAIFLVSQGEYTRAFDYTMQIEQVEYRAAALATLSIALADLEEIELAREVADNALRAAIRGRTNTSRAFAMIRTVKALAALGDETAAASLLARAMAESRNGMDRTSYSGFLIELADAYSLSGLHNQSLEVLEASLRTAEGIEGENMRVFPLAEVAGAFTKYGAANRAFDMVREAEDFDTQSLWLFFIADTL